MIITNNVSAPKASDGISKNPLDTNAGLDFMSAVEKVLAEQPAPAENTEAADYYDRGGVRWTDERYAGLIGGLAHIDTTKTINWNSKGDKELTENQIAELRSRYDACNMSPQDYYNLMSDLTHMEVMSGEDCIAPHLRKIDWGDQKFQLMPGPTLIGSNTGPEWDMIQHFLNSLEKLLAEQRLLNSDAFGRANTHFSAWDKQQNAKAVQKDIEEIEKVLSILKLL